MKSYENFVHSPKEYEEERFFDPDSKPRNKVKTEGSAKLKNYRTYRETGSEEETEEKAKRPIGYLGEF